MAWEAQIEHTSMRYGQLRVRRHPSWSNARKALWCSSHFAPASGGNSPLEHERDNTVLSGSGCHPLLSTPWAETWRFLGAPKPEKSFSIPRPSFSWLQKVAIYKTKGKACEQCCQCIIIRTGDPKQAYSVTKLWVFAVPEAQGAVTLMHSNLNQVTITVFTG